MSVTRRQVLKAGAGAMAMAALGPWWPGQGRAAARVREYTLVARPTKVSLGRGPEFVAWTYNGTVPGPLLRVGEGEVLRVKLVNRLPEGTTIHWHGVPLPNPMDGVPGVTQPAVPPGGSFTYEFVAGPAGTYLYHSHQGYQLDQGLYGGLIIEPRRETRGYDREYTLVLEDWVTRDGGGPKALRRRAPGGMGMMGGRMMGGRGRAQAGAPLLEPLYDAYAVNGRVYPAVEPLKVNKGDLVRLRLVNASSVTIYDLSLAGHRLAITHLDANPVQPVQIDVVRIAPGERVDVEFRADNPGRWLLAANQGGYGEGGLKVPVLYQGVRSGQPQPPVFSRAMRMAGYWDLRAARPSPLRGSPGPSYRQVLSGGMHSPYWTINGQVYPRADNLAAPAGRRVRLTYFNHSHMPHPMHLHGHFFRVVNPNLAPELWIKKDTLLVGPMGRATVEFLADNPGKWFHHCHNLYHLAAGMANTVEVK